MLGIETSCDETGVGIVRGDGAHRAAGQRGRVLRRRARPLRRRRARGRLPRAPGGDGARRAPRDGDGRGHRPRRRRRRRHRGARPLRRAARRRRRGQGLRHGLGRAALRRQPPRRARRRRHAAERPAARRASRCSSPAGTPACSTCRTSPARSRRSARRSTTRRARRSTRSPGCSGLPFPGGPHIDRVAREGDPARSRSRAGSPARATRPFDFSFSGLKTAVARLGRGARTGGRRRCRWPTSPRASRRPWSTCSPRRPCAPPASGGWTCCCSAAGWRPTRGCGRWPQERCAAAGLTLRVPRPGLCTDNGAMVAALGAHLVAAGAKPSPLDLPADSSLPVTQVLVG